MSLDYYDALTADQKRALAGDFIAGPEKSPPGVSPTATPDEIKAIAQKRFGDKFLRNDRCPRGHWAARSRPRPSIRDRLTLEGFLSKDHAKIPHRIFSRRPWRLLVCALRPGIIFDGE